MIADCLDVWDVQIEATAAGEDPRAALERVVELPGELVVGRTT